MDSRIELETQQLKLLRETIAKCARGEGTFYRKAIAEAGWAEGDGPESIADFTGRFPLTTKADLCLDRANHPPNGSVFTEPAVHYTRFHRTSGTTGDPMPWLDTPESWSSMLDGWEQIYRRAGVGSRDSVFCAFSFGPFIGFWLAFEAAARMGCLSIPGGGMSSTARAALLATSGATVLCCTPTYALRLGEVVRDTGAKARVEKLIVAGEPGGGIPETRAAISDLWNGARVFDHHGMTEVGPVSFEDVGIPDALGVLETSFIAEILSLEDGTEVSEGESGELVLTALRRNACPLLRYRTGDLVRKRFIEVDKVPSLFLDGGILGRTDDMVVVRGVNIYPSAVEGVVRRFPEVREFQVNLTKERAMNELDILVEWEGTDPGDGLRMVEKALGDAFALRIPVKLAESGSLPRYEFKSRRWV